MTVRDRFRELAAGAVLGGIEPDERRELATLLDDATPEERRLLAELEGTALLLAAGAPTASPPAELRERLRLRLRAPRRAPRLAKLAARLGLDRPRRALAAVAALTVVAVGSAVLAGYLWLRSGRTEGRIVELADAIARQEELLTVLRDPEVEVVPLQGFDETAEAYGKVIWGRASGSGLLQLAHLPPTPPGKVYQLWVFPRDGKPWSAGVVELAEGTVDRMLRLDDFAPGPRAGLRGFGVTVESPGAAQPGKEFLLGARLEP